MGTSMIFRISYESTALVSAIDVHYIITQLSKSSKSFKTRSHSDVKYANSCLYKVALHSLSLLGAWDLACHATL